VPNITKLKHRFPLKLIPSWPFFVLSLITITIAYLNYQPNTLLTGWDNLHPEYNFDLALKQAFYSVWQQKSLGFLSGMAPAADLVRIVFLALLHGIGMDISILRYVYFSSF
jgi:hypothetical protein